MNNTASANDTSAIRTSAEQIVLKHFRQLEHSGNSSAIRLRRATSLLDAHFEPVFHQTLKALRDAGYRWVAEDNLACALMLVARLKPSDLDFGKALAKKEFSEQRLRQLLASTSVEEFFYATQRAVSFVGGQVSPFSVIRCALAWTDSHADRVRRELLSQYHNVSLPVLSED